METIDWADFKKVDLRAGTILRAELFAEAKIPAYKLWIDLGDALGVKKSSAQITHYTTEALIGKQVLCVVNLKPKQVANFMSEVLVTGFVGTEKTVLAVPEAPIPNGSRLS